MLSLTEVKRDGDEWEAIISQGNGNGARVIGVGTQNSGGERSVLIFGRSATALESLADEIKAAAAQIRAAGFSA
jgi:hypothetical protein